MSSKQIAAPPGSVAHVVDPGQPAQDNDRVVERPLPPGGQGPRTLPDRAGRHEVSLPGHPVPGPNRERPGTMDHEVETSAERVRHDLRRPLAGSRNLLMKTAGNTVPVTDPILTQLCGRGSGVMGCSGWVWFRTLEGCAIRGRSGVGGGCGSLRCIRRSRWRARCGWPTGAG